MSAEVAPSPSFQQVTLAFHFRYIMPGEWLESDKVAVLLLARVLRVVRPDLKKAGSLLLRAGKLIYFQDRYGLGGALRDSYLVTAKRRFCRGQQCKLIDLVVPVDRTFVITVSGRIEVFQKQWSKRLRQHVRHPFLFSLKVDVDDPTQELVYLRQNTTIGELRMEGVLVREFESIEFEPHLSEMLDRLGLRVELSAAAMRTAIGLLEKPK